MEIDGESSHGTEVKLLASEAANTFARVEECDAGERLLFISTKVREILQPRVKAKAAKAGKGGSKKGRKKGK